MDAGDKQRRVEISLASLEVDETTPATLFSSSSDVIGCCKINDLVPFSFQNSTIYLL